MSPVSGGTEAVKISHWVTQSQSQVREVKYEPPYSRFDSSILSTLTKPMSVRQPEVLLPPPLRDPTDVVPFG